MISLAAIGQLDLIRLLYEQITIPSAVYREITSGGAAQPGVEEIEQARWLSERPLSSYTLMNALQLDLGQGEAEAIALAVESEAGLLLMDERRGRRAASRLGVPVVGVLGFL